MVTIPHGPPDTVRTIARELFVYLYLQIIQTIENVYQVNLSSDTVPPETQPNPPPVENEDVEVTEEMTENAPTGVVEYLRSTVRRMSQSVVGSVPGSARETPVRQEGTLPTDEVLAATAAVLTAEKAYDIVDECEAAFTRVIRLIRPVDGDGNRTQQRLIAQYILETLSRACLIGIVGMGSMQGRDVGTTYVSTSLQTNMRIIKSKDKMHRLAHTLVCMFWDGTEHLLGYLTLNDPYVVSYIGRQTLLTPEDILNARVGQSREKNPLGDKVFTDLIEKLKNAPSDVHAIDVVGTFLKEQNYQEREFAAEGCAKRSRLACMGRIDLKG